MSRLRRFEKNFPDVEDDIYISDKSSLIRKYTIYYPVLLDYLKKLQHGKSIVQVLMSKGAYRVGLYAVNEFMDSIIEDPLFGKLKEVKLYDLHKNQFIDGHLGYIVYGVNDLLKDYNQGRIEKIVICNLGLTNTIAEQFIIDGINPIDIITMYELIYS